MSPSSILASRRPRVLASLLNRPGFTLVEMLVVIVVIVLALFLAIPAIRALTGTKSEQAAQNTVSAYIASARADAIGLQDIEGVLFYIDPATNRVNCHEVAQSPFQVGDVPGVIYLDLEAGVHAGKPRDPLPLPSGIQLMTIKDTVVNNNTAAAPTMVDVFPNARYLGFNYFPPAKASALNAQLGGVILFDGSGRVYTGRYGFRYFATASNGTLSTTLSPLGALVFNGAAPSPTANWPAQSGSPTYTLISQVAFSFFDRESFLNQHDTNNNPFLDLNDSGGKLSDDTNPAQVSQDNWLDANTTPIFVNRYNGTLIRAE